MKARIPVSNRVFDLNKVTVVLLLCTLGGAFSLTASQAVAAPLPAFPDSALQACFDEQALAHGWQSAEDVDELLCPDRGITDTTGIDQLPNLIELDVSHNPLMLLGSIQGLQQTLQRLNLSHTRLCDLGELTGFTSLTGIFLNNIDFSCSVNPDQLEQELNNLLMDNPGLTHVGFSGFNISDPYNLFNSLPLNLRSLELSGASLTKLPIPLEEWDRLEVLDLSDNPLENLGPTQRLHRTLRQLNLSGTKLCDLSELVGFKALTHLFLNDIDFGCQVDPGMLDQQINDLLADNPALTHVGLNGFTINDPYSLFDKLSPELMSLELSDAGLTQIPVPLEQFAQLEVLDLSGNPLEFLGPIQGLETTLQQINLSDTRVCDLGQLVGLRGLSRLLLNDVDCPADPNLLEQQLNELLTDNPGLTHVGFNDFIISEPYILFDNLPQGLASLELSDAGLTDVPVPLEQFAGLEVLDLSENPLEFVGPIQGPQTTLQQLNLSGTKLCDLGELVGLTGLRRLLLNDIDFTCPAAPGQLEQDLNNLLMENPGLTHVGFSGFNINDPYELFNHLSPSLRSLELSGTGLTEAPFPMEFARLEMLDLSDNPLTYLEPTGNNLPRLRNLNLSGTELCDLGNVIGISGLTQLLLNDIDFSCPADPYQLEQQANDLLADNPGLTHVGLNGFTITDPYNLFNKLSPTLRSLQLSGTELTEAPVPLEQFTRLEVLDLSGNPLNFLGPLNGLALTLNKLDLSDTYLPDLDELTPLQGLTHLYLNHEQTVTYDTQFIGQILENNTELSHVGLSGIQLQSDSTIIYDALYTLPIVRLEIANTGVADLYMPFETINRLEYLDAGGNAIADVSVLYGAENLQHLNLEDNNIASVQALTGGLPAIEFLNLLGNDNIPCPELDALEASLNPGVQLIRPLSCQDGEPPAIDYCQAGGGNTSYEWIDKIGLNGASHQSGSNGGYADNTSVIFNLIRGDFPSIQLTPGFNSRSYVEQWAVWIDFNHNGEFESGEKIVSQSSNSTITAGFAVPTNAAAEIVRMRVAMRYGAEPEACGSFSWGEVEDYSVSISD